MLKECNNCEKQFETNQNKTVNYCEDCIAEMKRHEPILGETIEKE